MPKCRRVLAVERSHTLPFDLRKTHSKGMTILSVPKNMQQSGSQRRISPGIGLRIETHGIMRQEALDPTRGLRHSDNHQAAPPKPKADESQTLTIRQDIHRRFDRQAPAKCSTPSDYHRPDPLWGIAEIKSRIPQGMPRQKMSEKTRTSLRIATFSRLPAQSSAIKAAPMETDVQ